MKRRLLLFLLAKGNDVHHVQRGLHLCYPCIVVGFGYSAAAAICEAFNKNTFYHSTTYFPRAVYVSDSYRNEKGEVREFEFNGEPVVAEYYYLRESDFVEIDHKAPYHLPEPDRSSLEPDVFVKYYEKRQAEDHAKKASVA